MTKREFFKLVNDVRRLIERAGCHINEFVADSERNASLKFHLPVIERAWADHEQISGIVSDQVGVDRVVALHRHVAATARRVRKTPSPKRSKRR